MDSIRFFIRLIQKKILNKMNNSKAIYQSFTDNFGHQAWQRA